MYRRLSTGGAVAEDTATTLQLPRSDSPTSRELHELSNVIAVTPGDGFPYYCCLTHPYCIRRSLLDLHSVHTTRLLQKDKNCFPGAPGCLPPRKRSCRISCSSQGSKLVVAIFATALVCRSVLIFVCSELLCTVEEVAAAVRCNETSR